MKRTFTQAQLKYPESYMKARQRRHNRMMNRRRSAPAYIVPGVTRTGGAYRRSMPGSPEKKFWDATETDNGIATTGDIMTSLCLIPQGTTDISRIGNKILVKNINSHMVISIDDQGVAATSDGGIRIILYVDQQANGAACTAADILRGLPGTLSTASIFSFRNMDNLDRFKILKDKTYRISPQFANAASTNASIFRKNFNIKCSIPLYYSSTTGALTELRSNNIGICAIAQGALMNFTHVTRLKFFDQ